MCKEVSEEQFVKAGESYAVHQTIQQSQECI